MSPFTFVVGTTHLKAGLCRTGEGQRAEQAEALLHALCSFARSDEAIVLAGDFNSSNTATPQDHDGLRLQPLALPRLIAGGGFRCAYTEATGAPPPYTYWGGWVGSEVRATFDHVLLHGPVHAVGALEVPASAAVRASPCRLPNADYPSDHAYSHSVWGDRPYVG